jgi:hypothetical protein
MNVVIRLDSAVRAVCPEIDGVSVGTPGDPSTVRIDFRPAATDAERKAAESAVKTFDWSDAAQIRWEAARNVPAAAALLASADPIPQIVRVLFRAYGDELNESLRAGGLRPVLEDAVSARLAVYLAAGLSLPGDRPDK